MYLFGCFCWHESALFCSRLQILLCCSFAFKVWFSCGRVLFSSSNDWDEEKLSFLKETIQWLRVNACNLIMFSKNNL
jgi:hypothetical protein